MSPIAHRRLRAAVPFLIALSAAPLAAAQSDAGRDAPLRIEEIIVTAHPLSGEGLAQAVIVLDGDELDRQMQPSLGATVASQPGINSVSFGQAAGRPIIHGLGGPRVRVMEDRIDTMDASVTSGDHATAVEPYIADGIEILKGSSTLLYGTGAIGGVVDVHTGRIPHQVPEVPVSGRVEARGGDNAATRNGAMRVDGGAGSFAWHVDGFTREGGEYQIPGFAESERQRAAEAEEGEESEEEVRGIVEGSQFEAQGGAVGLSFIGERGLIGLAVSSIDAEYGLPGGHAHEHDGEEGGEEEEEGNPVLDMRQTRIDLELALNDPLAGFSSLNVRAGINDYRHVEIEPEGGIGTRFSNDAFETRAELVHDPLAGWDGVLGLQIAGREFAVSGEEAFVPPVDTLSAGLFWVGERRLGANALEAGVRLERVEHEPQAGGQQSFDAYSASIGYVIAPDALWTVGLLADFSARAPVAEELYSFGPHLATRSFDVGDSTLNEEKALNLSATFNYRTEDVELYATVYRIDFQDFIYQFATGDLEDDLTVLQYTQDDATFYGFDLKVDTTLYNFGFDRRLRVSAMFDTVDAELDVTGDDRLPLIPPTRYGVGLSLDWDNVYASLDYMRVADQDEVAAQELPTDAYNDLRAYFGASVPMARGALDVFLQGRNLTDDEQRSHTSLIKDFAPLPGRTIEAGVRLSF